MKRNHFETIYICGPLSCMPKYQEILNFNKAENILNNICFHVINPMYLCMSNYVYKRNMILRLRTLIKSDAIYLLDGWKNDKDSRIERCVAKIFHVKEIKISNIKE